jgi:hypothetical protein
VEHAILAAQMLQLAHQKRASQKFMFSPLVPLIVQAGSEDKRVFFRVHLDQYGPFMLFMDRLRVGTPPQQAAVQVCAVHNFADDPVVAWRAFENWGTFAGSLIRAENGQYAPATVPGTLNLLRQSVDRLFTQEQDARQLVLDYLGQEAFEFIEGDIRDSLISAILMFSNNNDPIRVILQLGNTYESFLRLVGYRRVNLRNAHGIIQLGDRLRGSQLIAQKHLGAIGHIGQIRNATDHGGDPNENNRSWQITRSITQLTILTALSSMRSIVLYRQRRLLEL